MRRFPALANGQHSRLLGDGRLMGVSPGRDILPNTNSFPERREEHENRWANVSMVEIMRSTAVCLDWDAPKFEKHSVWPILYGAIFLLEV